MNGNMEVFNNINAELARNKMSKEQFAQKLGICRRTYQNWETKNYMPLSAFIKSAAIFGKSLDELAEDKTISKGTV